MSYSIVRSSASEPQLRLPGTLLHISQSRTQHPCFSQKCATLCLGLAFWNLGSFLKHNPLPETSSQNFEESGTPKALNQMVVGIFRGHFDPLFGISSSRDAQGPFWESLGRGLEFLGKPKQELQNSLGILSRSSGTPWGNS